MRVNPRRNFRCHRRMGPSVGLKDFRGKWVVSVLLSEGQYSRLHDRGAQFSARYLDRYTQNNAVVVGVSVDSTGSHQDFCAKQGLTFKLLADTGKKVSAEYGSLRNLVAIKISARNTFLIDPDGKIARVWIGVDPGKHSDEVLAALGELGKKS